MSQEGHEAEPFDPANIRLCTLNGADIRVLEAGRLSITYLGRSNAMTRRRFGPSRSAAITLDSTLRNSWLLTDAL